MTAIALLRQKKPRGAERSFTPTHLTHLVNVIKVTTGTQRRDIINSRPTDPLRPGSERPGNTAANRASSECRVRAPD